MYTRTGPPKRIKLPVERQGLTHKVKIEGLKIYITVGLYENGVPGEVFLRAAKQGSTISGLLDTISLTMSIGLQYGVPLKALIKKFNNTNYAPSGWTTNPKIPFCSSMGDYLAKWLALKFLTSEERAEVLDPEIHCSVCGAVAVQSGGGFSCTQCGKQIEVKDAQVSVVTTVT